DFDPSAGVFNFAAATAASIVAVAISAELVYLGMVSASNAPRSSSALWNRLRGSFSRALSITIERLLRHLRSHLHRRYRSVVQMRAGSHSNYPLVPARIPSPSHIESRPPRTDPTAHRAARP